MKFFEDGDRVQLYKGDCLEIMPQLEGQFDAIICDLPYGITTCSWDVVISFEPLWECYKRLIRPNGAIVLFGSQPFTTDLIMSNRKWFKYCWVWDKGTATAPGVAKFQPMRTTEDIVVFGLKPAYYPQKEEMTISDIKRLRKGRYKNSVAIYGNSEWAKETKNEVAAKGFLKHPKNLLRFDVVHSCTPEKVAHPTQKPIDLLSYLIRTYTLPNDRILDNTAGSFSTGVAAILNGRKFVGIEREEKYCSIGQQRIEKALQEVDSMLIKPWEIDSAPVDTYQQINLFEAV